MTSLGSFGSSAYASVHILSYGLALSKLQKTRTPIFVEHVPFEILLFTPNAILLEHEFVYILFLLFILRRAAKSVPAIFAYGLPGYRLSLSLQDPQCLNHRVDHRCGRFDYGGHSTSDSPR